MFRKGLAYRYNSLYISSRAGFWFCFPCNICDIDNETVNDLACATHKKIITSNPGKSFPFIDSVHVRNSLLFSTC